MDTQKDLGYTFSMSRQCLRILGIWPDPHGTSSGFRRLKLRFVFAVCLQWFYVFIPQLLNIVHSWGNISLLIKNIAAINFSFMAFSKLIVTWYHGKTLRTLTASVETDWKISKESWERNTMLKMAERGRDISLKFYVIGAITVALYFAINLIQLHEHLQGPVDQRELIYHFAYPYNSHKSPNYQITFLIQMSAGLYAVFINASIGSFISMLLLHISAQLINLRLMLKQLVSKLGKKSISSSTFMKDLSAIIVRHENIIRSAETIGNCFSTMLLAILIAITIQMCFKSFQFFTIITDTTGQDTSVLKMLFFFAYFLIIVTELFFYCYSAERLLTESTNIAYGVFECKWYDLSSKDAKNLLFLMYRSNVPLKLAAGKFANFSLEMFGATVQTSMGYLSVLLTLNN